MKHIISTLVLTVPLLLAAQTPILVKTFPNPTPADGVFFGWAMAPLGNDRVLVGAPYVADSPPGGGFTYYSGEAYLFSTNGTLLNTFTNPTPQNEDLFGNAIATIGNDLILIAAYGDNAEAEDAGVIHLFAPNGALLNTITNPQPTNGACFGYSLAVVGNDRILAGVPGELWFAGPASAGVAYLISTNGALLATFTNPAPTLGDNFGSTVATVGTEYILIGAPGDDQGALDAGRAYLFRTNGALVTAFDNPTPGANDQFSFRLSAFDNDRVLIGCPRDSSTVSMAGAAYLFDINGTLLKTFTQNAVNQNFGIPTALGNLVLVGAPSDNTGAAGAGAAYLYTTNGTLVATITNPAPASADHFGYKFVPVGSDRVLISGEWEAGAVGAVYLYSLPLPPSLTIRRTGSTTVAVSWPAAASNFVLQQNTNSVSSINWSNITSGIQNDGTNKTLLVNPTNHSGLYRLIIP
jgi:FG-GAP repeat